MLKDQSSVILIAEKTAEGIIQRTENIANYLVNGN